MIIVNGQCPTWFVVKWLTKHPTHAANSTKTEGSLSSEFAFVSHDRNGTPVIVGATLVRSNWTIYDEHGSKVEFNKKRRGNDCEGRRRDRRLARGCPRRAWMVNGKCSTGQVVLWLEKHPTHKGEAPETDSMRAQRVNTAFHGSVVFGFLSRERGWVGDSFPPHRSDWTIYNARGRKVRFKKKRRVIRTGVTLKPGEWIEAISAGGVTRYSYVAKNGGEILIHERRK